ncbi:MAG TPA: M42 family metallopeptidase [Anaerolineales bacterium]|nr:M42 family metallopeptidase [Anaerolineales bacterium]
MKNLIQRLVEITGPSGYEHDVRTLVRGEIEKHADEIRVDALGNLIARVGSAPTRSATRGKRIMISAHMDEIGIIATHVDKDGFIRFTNLGGVYPRNCVGGRVRFLNGVPGVIGQEKAGAQEAKPLSEMYIDVGAKSRKDCPVKIGDVAAFDRPFTDLGDRLVSKAMDDRIGVAVGIEALKKLEKTPHEVYFVFSVQEEVGLRGATTSAYGVDPEIGLAIDVTGSGDTPNGIRMEVGLGKGPAVKVRDGGMLSDPRVIDWMVAGAKRAKLPYQLEILEGGTTDARAIQLARAGVPAGCLSIPCRYVHTPSEMVDYDDVRNAVSLLVEMLSRPIDFG